MRHLTVSLTEQEVKILRALLMANQQMIEPLPQTIRERIVLKLHAALEDDDYAPLHNSKVLVQ